jgi:hypothetical protein
MTTLIALALMGCVDYRLKAGEQATGGGGAPSGEDTAPRPDTGADDAPRESCNGEDDDGDGQVDEDYADADADGTADCVDRECEIDALPAGTTGPSTTCGSDTGPPVADPWRARVAWQWRGLTDDPCINSVAMTPLVVQLDDDDGDGAIGPDDDAEVVFVAIPSSTTPGCWTAESSIVVLDAATGAQELVIDADVNFGAVMTVADLDGDGAAEILAYDVDNALHAWRIDGTELWRTGPRTPYIGGMPTAVVADLEGDGTPEVIAQATVLEGRTGAERFTYTVAGYFLDPVSADLDGDGRAEIVSDGSVFANDGTRLWTGLTPRDSFSFVYGMVLDVDGDPDGEVVQAESDRISVFDADGRALASARFSSGLASTPCAADLDDDGEPELVLPAQTRLHAFEVDGSIRWSVPIKDTSTAAGCIAADLDGDGAAEVLYADEEAFLILDGRTGATRLSWSEHGSGTLLETPSVADVDKDGALEVLVSSNDNNGTAPWTGVTMLEHDGDGWAAGPTAWPSASRVYDRQDDAGVVRSVGRWWDVENAYRGTEPSVTEIPDVAVTVTDACTASCEGDGVASIALLVANPGSVVLGAGTPVYVYARTGSTRSRVAEVTLPMDLAPGETSGTLQVDVPATALDGDGVEVTILEDDADCHPEDNVALWLEPSGCAR